MAGPRLQLLVTAAVLLTSSWAWQGNCARLPGRGKLTSPRLASPSESQEATSIASPPLSPKALFLLATTGGVVGPAVDGIHNSVLLQYDLFPVEPLGLFKTSLLIPPLLAVAYTLLGAILPYIVRQITGLPGETGVTKQLPLVRASSGIQAALAVASTISIILLSKILHEDPSFTGTASLSCLSGAALAQWALLDGTAASLLLATTAAFGGPVAEIPLMEFGGAWHYLTPDYFPFEKLGLGPDTSAGLEILTGPCYFAVTTDAIALFRFFSRATSTGATSEEGRAADGGSASRTRR